MMQTYTTCAGDVLDRICWQYYGSNEQETTAIVLAANRGLADLPAILPAGIVIQLPDIAEPSPIVDQVFLWS